MHVCVLGAGIAGLSTAYLLSGQGHRVTVIDRGEPGGGASAGNGAQLSWSYVQPLADPSIWWQLPKLLLSPASPLKLRPQVDPQQWRWALAFLAACNAARSRATTERLLALATRSRAEFEAFREREAVACDYSATGKLVVLRSEASFAAARSQMGLQAQLGGAPQQAVGRDEVLAIEPALAHGTEPIAGAIYTPTECAADCYLVCQALVRILRERGVALRTGTAVAALRQQGERVVSARLATGEEVPADAFVLSMGTGSLHLAQPLGVRLPVYPLKGYSITVDIADGSAGPRVSVTDSARKVVFARIGQRLRVAGMAELVGDDPSIPPERIATLRSATEAVFPGAFRFDDVHPWTGMRPATPTGEPIVGRHPRGPANLLFNTGHGALGFTLAFGTAQQVAAALPPVA